MADAPQREEKDITNVEKVFDLIGWAGFIFMVPLALTSFGLPDFARNLEANIGPMGSSNALLAMFYGCQLARTIFGSGRIIMPLLVGAASSFIIIAATVDIGFMLWWKELLKPLGWFWNQPLALVMGLLTLMLGYLLSRARKLAGFWQILLLVILPLGGIFALHYFKVAALLGLAGS